MRFWPCKPCCDYVCLVSDGDLDGVECVGNWTRDEGGYNVPNHSIDTDDGIWYDPTPQKAGLPWRVQAIPRIDISLTGGFAYGTFHVLLLGGFVDCDNYVFLRYTEHRPDASSLSYIQLELGIMIDGVESIMALHVLDSQDCYDKTAATEMATQWGFENGELHDWNSTNEPMILCWDGTTLTGSVPFYFGTSGEFSGDRLQIAAIRAPDGVSDLANQLLSNAAIRRGRFAGLAVGTLSSEINKVVFESFDFRHFEVDDSNGDPCGECVPQCCGSPTPPEMIVEVSGIPSGRSVGTPMGCTIDCSDFNGTFYLASQIGSFGGGALECTGDGSCRWVYSAAASDSECDEGSYPDQPYAAVINIIGEIVEWGNVSGVPTRQLYLSISISNGPDTPVTIVTVNESLTTSCEEWTDWITLTAVMSDNFCSEDGNVVIRIKMVP